MGVLLFCAMIPSRIAMAAEARQWKPPTTRDDSQLALAHSLLLQVRDTNAREIDLGGLLAAVGDFDAGEAVSREAAATWAKGRDEEVIWCRLALGYAHAGDVAGLRNALTHIESKDREWLGYRLPGFWCQAGQIFGKHGQIAEGRAALTTARELIVTHEDPELMEGSCHDLIDVFDAMYRLNDYSDASLAFKQAVQTGASATIAGGPWCLTEAAVHAARFKLYAEAENAAVAAGNAHKNEVELGAVSDLARSGRLDEANQAMRAFGFSDVPNSIAISFAIGCAHTGRRELARGFLEKWRTHWQTLQDPWSKNSQIQEIAETYAEIGDAKEAARWLDRAAELAETGTVLQGGPGPFAGLNAVDRIPGSLARRDNLQRVAIIQARLGLREKARANLFKARAAAGGQSPGMWENTALYCVAEAQAKAGFLDDALETMEKPTDRLLDWQAYAKIAAATAVRGDWPHAEQIIAKYVGTGSLGASIEMVMALEKKGDLTNALRYALIGRWNVREVAGRIANSGGGDAILKLIHDPSQSANRVALILGLVDSLLADR
ncbi:MAG TPA: hypothetical protein VFE47_07220 [Tepidisphaeraceae bacterium]|nr:hypothetical protein [Tepidisphaeraceae bacterium]